MVTNEAEFLRAVDALANPRLSDAQRRLLVRMHRETSLAVRFDGRGGRHDLYKVYSAETDIWLLMVYENGEVWAEYHCADEAGHPETAAIYRALTSGNGWSKKVSSDATCSVEVIAAVAEGPRVSAAVTGGA